MLFALAQAYGLNYDTLLRLAGHIERRDGTRRSPYGAVAWKALSELDEEEQRQALEFMTELRRRRNGTTTDQ